MVFSSDKSVGISAQEHLEDLTNKRKAIAKPALEALKNIEYIMGEFSGLGLIDIVAIQSALWLMDRDKLVGLIDANAYARLAKHRADLNLSGISRSDDVLESLKEFEKKLKNVYSLIQLYFNQVYNGQEFTSP
jgi:PHD/YefM family antitoxin component YafN of YafNO toxin-antitoxin module